MIGLRGWSAGALQQAGTNGDSTGELGRVRRETQWWLLPAVCPCSCLTGYGAARVRTEPILKKLWCKDVVSNVFVIMLVKELSYTSTT